MQGLDIARFEATPLVRAPFPYVIVPEFVRPEARRRINAAFPGIASPGSFPIQELTYGPEFGVFLKALQAAGFRDAFARKFDIDLAGRPTMITVRGQCGTKDGNIHTDAVTKLITVLIYMNSGWEETGGRLRLLRSADDLEDVIAEVPPTEGTLVAFRRTDNSYHGHKPFIGPRRVIQLNWVTSRGVEWRENMRHRMSAWLKRLGGVLRAPERRRAA